MGYSGWSSVNYAATSSTLKDEGKVFARSTMAATTGEYKKNIADHLNPRKLKNGKRESCFADGFSDATPIIVAMDGTGSMQQVPHVLQKELPKLIELLTEQDISDHPNVLFIMFDDDEAGIVPDACFQMSQFETDADKLLGALNEMIIPGAGGGNRGESYHLAIYAAAYHTRIESFEERGEKGFFFIVGDEEPGIDDRDPKTWGTSPSVAKEVFGDTIEKQVTMVEALKELSKKYHVFAIRPLATAHGSNVEVQRKWQNFFTAAGVNPQHVIQVKDTDAIVSTIAMTIGQMSGEDAEEMAEVLTAKNAAGVSSALVAVKGIPKSGKKGSVAKTDKPVKTTDTKTDTKKVSGRKR